MISKKNTQQRDVYIAATEKYLKRKGYEVLEREWECSAGVADLIATDENFLVFVEVKGRDNTEKSLLVESVDTEKREKFERIAAMYLRDCPICDVAVRFDVVSIIDYGDGKAILHHLINAFG